ncbi:hypothetical protein [Streptomyces sp. TRM49041]|uniref:hypothetical protein n=1 Tax=Streptomyces sp. TRM49041 TaxID=2603216 RepID=UPI0011EE6647|nr:hypothetical protein [Streptomyces sp. TRM49041]
MKVKPLRSAALVALVVTGLYVGVWAYFLPEKWYDGFPGFGRTWLPPLGPYNEHLAKDTGALYLALALLSAAALRRANSNRLVRTTGAAWLVFNALHLVYHMQHLHVYGTTDKVLNVVGLGALMLISAALLIPVRAAPRQPSRIDD